MESSEKSGRSVELAPRALPTQKRARELVEKILDTTAALLDEVGVDALTTNLIAQRAEIRVASVYRYYPNKFAVMAAVWDRVISKELSNLDGFMQTSIGVLSLDEVVDELVDTALRVERESPGILTLLRSMRVTPELREMEISSSEMIASSVAGWLSSVGANATGRRLELVARTLVEATLAILEFASSTDDASSDVVVAELRLLLKSYFANYFEEE